MQTDFFQRAVQQQWLVRLLERFVPPLDRFLLKISRGWLSTAMQTIVWMETTGARSGEARETVTLCMPDGPNVVLVGSNWGREKHPAWVFNLRSNPQARIRFRGYVGPVKARELTGEKRVQMWQRLVEYSPQYQRYADRVSRELPVILLERS